MCNQIMVNGLNSIQQAIQILNAMNVVVLDYRHDGISKPTITIEHHPYCQELINEGVAAYYLSGSVGNGLYQQGQFALLDCRVVWQERATNRIKGQQYEH